jgi:chromatin remodeling complex protein RSC6
MTIIEEAKAIAEKAVEKSKETNISQGIKDALLSSSKEIQSILNSVLSSSGVLTQDQYNRLDEQMRIAKKNMLETETLEATKRFAIYATFVIVLCGVVYFISKK